MTDQPFSNRELEAKFNALHDLATETLAQTKKTNGRVNGLEDRANKFERWQSFIQGGLAILTIMVVPILIYFITNWK